MTKEKFMNYQTRVEQGAAWLDDNYPGWEHRVNLETLDLANVTDCVLSQVSCSPYWTILPEACPLTEYLDRQNWAVDRGFNVDDYVGDYNRESSLLTDEWKRFIRNRRGVVTPGPDNPEVLVEGKVTVGGKEINLPPVTLDYLLKLVEANR